MVETTNNPFANLKQELDVDGKKYNYYNLKGLDCKHLDSIPYSIRVLLESAVRNCDSFHIHKSDVETILDWHVASEKDLEIPFKPARVLL